MSRQIAVLMCAVNTDNQRRILEGMIDAAKETDSNLFVFQITSVIRNVRKT